MNLIQTPLVIIPGWGGSHETWAPFVQEAKKKFAQISVFDLPGFGNEPPPKTVWGVEEYADFVKDHLTSLGKTPVFLLGHSFGGAVATLVVERQPEMIRGLILVGAAIIRPKHQVRRTISWCIRTPCRLFFCLPQIGRFRGILQRMFHRLIRAGDYQKVNGIKRFIFQKIIRQDLQYLLPSIRTPALVLWGKKDAMTPLRHGKKIASLLSHATLLVAKNGRHGLHLDHRPFLLESIVYFCSRLDRRESY